MSIQVFCVGFVHRNDVIKIRLPEMQIGPYNSISDAVCIVNIVIFKLWLIPFFG